MNIDAYKSTLDRITETITQADPDFVLDPTLDPLSQIAQALPNVIGGGSAYPEAMTTTELKEFLESKGWSSQGGSFTYEVGGTSYTATATSGFVIPLYPADQFPAGNSGFSDGRLVIPDGVTTIKFLVPTLNVGRTAATLKSKISIGKPYCAFAFCGFSDSYIKITEIGGNNQQNTLFTCNKSTTHGYMDMVGLSTFNANYISIAKGENCTMADIPRISLGAAKLTEDNLTALLALLNS